MFGYRHHKSNVRHSLLIFAAIVMMVRALVPSGWMLSADEADGELEIQLCSGHFVNWSPENGFGSQIEQSQDEQVPSESELTPQCPYALSAQAVSDAGYHFEDASSVWTSLTIPRPSTGPPKTRSNQTQLPARGPPYSA